MQDLGLLTASYRGPSKAASGGTPPNNAAFEAHCNEFLGRESSWMSMSTMKDAESEDEV